jgi:UDP-N-acetylmuramoyl-L-alanyl-D-glutamate--2,6-diaminopimelate ligase
MDSREVTPGDAFVAIAGFGAHGLNFVDAARDRRRAPRSCSSRRRPRTCRHPPMRSPVPGLRTRMGAMADSFHGIPARR